MRRAYVAVLAIASLALIAGCDIGGDDQLSKEEFNAKATEIDKRVSDSFDTVFENLDEKDLRSNKPVSEKTKAALAEAAQTEKDAVAELADLKPPEEGQAAVDELVRVAGAQADNLAEAAKNPDLTGKDLEEAFSAEDPEKPITELRELGLWPQEQNGQ